MEPDLELLREALGEPVVGWAPAHERGYTQTRRWRVRTASGPRFVKEAWNEGALAMLRREALVYVSVTGPFMAGFEGFADAGDHACMAIELLDRACWPPPYPDDTRSLFDAIDQIAETVPPVGLPPRPERPPLWERIGADPGPFLGLGLCSNEWLERSLDGLIAAERQAVVVGDDLVHNDIWSGNVCFDGGRAILIDWGCAARGNRRLDTAFASLSIRVEGGRRPDVALPDEGPYAAWLAGHNAIEATTGPPDWAEPGSTLRADQVGDLAVALRWAVEVIDLPPLH